MQGEFEACAPLGTDASIQYRILQRCVTAEEPAAMAQPAPLDSELASVGAPAGVPSASNTAKGVPRKRARASTAAAAVAAADPAVGDDCSAKKGPNGNGRMSAAVVAATGSAPTPKPLAKRKQAARGDSSTDSDSDTCYHGGAAAEDMQPRARLSRACTLASTSIQPAPAQDEDSSDDSSCEEQDRALQEAWQQLRDDDVLQRLAAQAPTQGPSYSEIRARMSASTGLLTAEPSDAASLDMPMPI